MDKPEITRDDILQIADELEGTAGSLDTILEERFGIQMEEVPIDLLAALDDRVMQCACCGWWSESSEFDDETQCAECQE